MKTGATAPLIAVVDDDESARKATDSLLRSAGYRSVVFESGEAFLESTLRQEAACVILDIEMPGMSGIAVQRRLLEMKNPAPIIFLTGHDGVLRETALRQGAFAVLSKTSGGESLLATISAALAEAGER